VLVDCPPSLNLVTVNAMAAAHSILVPLQCEFFALEGLSQLLKTVEQVRSSLNPGLTIHGIVLTMYERATISPARSSPTCAASWARRVYETMIPRNVRISEAPSYGKPVLLYDLKCVAARLMCASPRDHPARALAARGLRPCRNRCFVFVAVSLELSHMAREAAMAEEQSRDWAVGWPRSWAMSVMRRR